MAKNRRKINFVIFIASICHFDTVCNKTRHYCRRRFPSLFHLPEPTGGFASIPRQSSIRAVSHQAANPKINTYGKQNTTRYDKHSEIQPHFNRNHNPSCCM